MCSLFFADLGADVIKIESPKGDPMRYIDANKNTSPYFDALNRNKKSVSIDLKTPKGKKSFINLAKNADIIIEGFRPGKADSLGIGYKDIKKVNPGIIYCSISGYGQKGNYKGRAGHDLNYSSLSGMLDIMSNKPFVPGVQIADTGCALIAAFSILACVFYRKKRDKGNYIDVSIFRSALSLIGIHIAKHSIATAKNKKTILSGSKPCYNIYKTKDKKYLSLCAVEKKFWESFCDSIDRNDLLLRQFDETAIEELNSIFKNRNSNEWLALNERHDFCCEPVKKIGEVINDEYLNKKEIIIKLGDLKQVAFPVEFSSIKKINYKKCLKTKLRS